MKTLVDLRKGAASAFLTLFVLAGAATLLSACNTTAGFGEDLQSAGSALTHSSKQTREKL